MSFEPFIGALNATLGKRLPGPPPDCPAPRLYLLLAKKFQVHRSVASQVELHVLWASITPTNGSTEPSLPAKTEIRPQGRWDQVTRAVKTKTKNDQIAMPYFAGRGRGPGGVLLPLQSTAHRKTLR